MKKTALFIFLINAFVAFGQQNAKNRIDSILIQMLEEEDILLSDAEKRCTSNCMWTSEKQKKRLLNNDKILKEKLLDKFIVPSFCNGKTINSNYTFPNTSIVKLGSYIIRKGNFNVIQSTHMPELPQLLSGRQISIVDPLPDGSNYLLNYTTESLFKGQSKTALNADFLNYLNLKQDISFNMTDNNKRTLTLGVGVFRNELAELFLRAKNNKIKSKEFYALYEIWLKHSKEEIQTNDSVIRTFEGLCSYQSKGVKSDSEIQFNTEFKADYNQFPFLSLSSSNKLNWGRSTALNGKFEVYDIFMFNRPQLASIPTAQIILNNWKNLRDIPENVIQLSDNIPYKKPLEIQVKFGPIAHHDFIGNIKLDEKYTLDRMASDEKFIEKIELGSNVYNEETNIVTFTVKIVRDENFIKNYSTSIQLAEKLDIRLYYDQAVKIGDTETFLDIIYKNIPVSAELKPVIEVQNDILNASKNGNNYIYNASGSIIVNDNQNISKKPKVIDVLKIPTQTISGFKDRIMNAAFSLEADNKFSFEIKLPDDMIVFTNNEREMNIELVVEFSDKVKNTFKRKIPITLLAHNDHLKTNTQSVSPIAFNSTESLLASLNDNTMLPDGQTVRDLKDKHTNRGTNELNINNFLEELRVQSEMTISSDAKYLIKPIFIDKSKMK